MMTVSQAPSSERTLVIPRASIVIEKKAPSRALFREQAVHAHLASVWEGEAVRIAPAWARHVLVVASLIVTMAIGATLVLVVDQVGHGRGVLRVTGGVQSVVAEAAGSILAIEARSGDVVEAGALLARIDSTITKTALLDAEQQIARAEADVAHFTARSRKEEASRLALLEQRSVLLQRRAASQSASASHLRDRLGTFDRLVDAGVASKLDRGAAEDELATADRGTLELAEQISGTRLQASTIRAQLTAELDRLNAEVQKARNRREALVFQLQQTEIRAPRRGRLEALVVKIGDGVAVGTPIARLVPEGAPREVVVFLPEADRAFLKEGSECRIELDQLPVGEFGSLPGRVDRIASYLATPAEIAEALGNAKLDGPSFLVAVRIEKTDEVQKLDHLLRPGSLVTGRFVLRNRRLASVMFEPLKNLLGGDA
jgi:multidrug resistance efflux pump